MASLTQSTTGDIKEHNDTTNWKKKYEKEKKEKNKLSKQIEHYKVKLKKANIDVEKASQYYKKQIEIFKSKQKELLKHISSTNYSSKKQDIKYVFIEDIKQIKLIGKKRKNASIEIHFANGESGKFNNINIIINDENENENKNEKENENKNEKDNKSNEANEAKQQKRSHLELILCEELQKRIEDINNLINITFQQKYMINDNMYDDNTNNTNNDDISLQMRLDLIEYVNKIKQRHNKYNLYDRIQKRSHSHVTSPKANTNQKRKSKSELNKNNSYSNYYLQLFHENNGLWRNLLLNFPIDIVGILSYELNDRIHDLQNVKDVLYKNEEALYDTITDIMIDIKSRHKDSFRSWNKTNNTHKLIQKWKHIINDVCINNQRWRKQIHFDYYNITTIINGTYNNYTKHATAKSVGGRSNDSSVSAYSNDSSNDTIATNDIRNDFIDSLKVNQHTVQLLTFIGAYLNRIVPTSPNDSGLHKLYLPILINDPHNVIVAMLDGVLFAILINILRPDYIDLRAIEVPSDPVILQPLSETQISNNLIIIFSSLRSLNMQLPHWSIHDYFDANHTVNIMLAIVFQLFYKIFDNNINIKTYPQLYRLCQNESERQNAPYFTWKKWLNKWLKHLKEPKSNPLHSIINRSEDEKKDIEINIDRFETNEKLMQHILHTIDYTDYLILICCRMDKDFKLNKFPQIQAYRKNNKQQNNNNDIFTSKLIYDCVTNVIGVNTTIKISDLSSHNPLLQQILLSDIFKCNNKIAKINTNEQKIISQMIHIPNKEEMILIAWINSFFDDNKLYINNIKYSLNDGIIILKLLDKLKNGCVDWKLVEFVIRHKFDKLTNCKLIMDVCNDNFLFNLIGLNSSDIVDGNMKYLQSLVYQIMCYSDNILLSEIQFNNKYVTGKMILQWINNRIKSYKKKVTKHKKLKLMTIKSFRDNQLNDSILFCNLLCSIQSGWINYNLIAYIPKTNNNQKQYKKERFKILNAKYCITTIRKLGGKVFFEPNDIVMSDEKAILSIITNIMIIAAKHSDNDQLIT